MSYSPYLPIKILLRKGKQFMSEGFNMRPAQFQPAALTALLQWLRRKMNFAKCLNFAIKFYLRSLGICLKPNEGKETAE